MKASELIKSLQDAITEHGDLQVGVFVDEYGVYSEVPNVSGKRIAEAGKAFFDSDDESLYPEFIALG